jgi:D-3-phosphoglycerate dehydrogenase
MPLANPEVFRTLRPFIDLADKIGSLQTQLADHRIQKIEVEFHGDIDEHVKILTVALLRGLLAPILTENVNYINAPHLANRRGIAVSQTQGLSTSDYPNLISCKAYWRGGSRLIVGTIFHTNEPRILQVDQYRVDLNPEGRMLVVDSVDVPGVIGKMGTILGNAGVNIASMRLGRTQPGGKVMTFLKIDEPVAAEVLQHMESTEPITRVRQVVLSG